MDRYSSTHPSVQKTEYISCSKHSYIIVLLMPPVTIPIFFLPKGNEGIHVSNMYINTIPCVFPMTQVGHPLYTTTNLWWPNNGAIPGLILFDFTWSKNCDSHSSVNKQSNLLSCYVRYVDCKVWRLVNSPWYCTIL
jgi:hypothetical protein